MNQIAAVVVTYNRKKLLKTCIESLLAQSEKKLDIIIIDNASTDGTGKLVSELSKQDPRVLYKNTGANLGGAGGFSYGIRYAVEKGYDYLWIMDDDTFPKEDALKELWNAHHILDGHYGFLSSFAVWTDGSACEMNVPTPSENWRKDISCQFDHSMLQLESASFVSMFIPAQVVKIVGLPIKEFFIWADDMEYTKRISRKYACYFVYKSQVIHAMAENKATSIAEASPDRLSRYQYLYRNRYYVAHKGSKRERFLFWLYVKNTIRDIKHSSCSKKGKRKWIVIKSCMKGFFFHPAIEYVKKGGI